MYCKFTLLKAYRRANKKVGKNYSIEYTFFSSSKDRTGLHNTQDFNRKSFM